MPLIIISLQGKVLDENGQDTDEGTSERNALEVGLYGDHSWKINDQFHLSYGLHLSNFSVLGANTFVYEFDERGERIDSTFYQRGELIKNYLRFEPRISIAHYLNDDQWLEASFSRTHQYLQRISSVFCK